jgi:hypothetical protein
MMKFLLAALFLISITEVDAQQKILLIGTKHTTPETELVQIRPVYNAVI